MANLTGSYERIGQVNPNAPIGGIDKLRAALEGIAGAEHDIHINPVNGTVVLEGKKRMRRTRYTTRCRADIVRYATYFLDGWVECLERISGVQKP